MGHGIIKHKNMKFIALAALSLLGQVSAVRFPSSEGPTKVDLGEDDPKVVGRADDDPEATKWHKENPLGWTDDGDDDGVVLTMVDGSLKRISSHKYNKKNHNL